MKWLKECNLQQFFMTFDNFDGRPEYAKYSSDEEDDEEEILGEPFVKEREIDEQEMDKVFIKLFIHSLFIRVIGLLMNNY